MLHRISSDVLRDERNQLEREGSPLDSITDQHNASIYHVPLIPWHLVEIAGNYVMLRNAN